MQIIEANIDGIDYVSVKSKFGTESCTGCVACKDIELCGKLSEIGRPVEIPDGECTRKPIVWAVDVRKAEVSELKAKLSCEIASRRSLAESFREYLLRVSSQVPFEHAAWAEEQGRALLEQLKK